MTWWLVPLATIVVVFILVPIAQSLLSIEANGWIAVACRALIRAGTNRLPEADRGRWQEEWEAEQADLAGRPLTALAHALRVRKSAASLAVVLERRAATEPQLALDRAVHGTILSPAPQRDRQPALNNRPQRGNLFEIWDGIEFSAGQIDALLKVRQFHKPQTWVAAYMALTSLGIAAVIPAFALIEQASDEVRRRPRGRRVVTVVGRVLKPIGTLASYHGRGSRVLLQQAHWYELLHGCIPTELARTQLGLDELPPGPLTEYVRRVRSDRPMA
jgi:hypothetical protein